MQSFLFWLMDFIRGRWVSRAGESTCRACAFKVALLLGLLIWDFPHIVPEAVVRLWVSHGADRPAWGVMYCVALTVGTILHFVWLGRGFGKNRKEADWRIPVVRIR
jgi:hypothetical protein